MTVGHASSHFRAVALDAARGAPTAAGGANDALKITTTLPDGSSNTQSRLETASAIPNSASVAGLQSPFADFHDSPRSAMLPKLPQLLPQFNTNHRDRDGTHRKDAVANDTPAITLLTGLLHQLSPSGSETPRSGVFPSKRSSQTSAQTDNGSAPENAGPNAQKGSNTDLDMIGDYAFDKTIGEGSYGKVKLATHVLTGEKVAIKCLEKASIHKTVGTAERVLREILVLSHLAHPNICRLLQVIDSPTAIYMVLEYEAGGELFDFILKNKRLQEPQARKLLRQILSAIQYCHANGVVHRDLKPENLLMDRAGNIKIIDFGFSNLMRDNSLLETFCGSAAYAAPEMLSGKKYIGNEVDIWSMGVILFVLVCGYLPFDDRHVSRMFTLILSGKYKFPEFVTEEFKDLITKILKVKPEQRATLEQIRDHPWVNANGKLPKVRFYEPPPSNETLENYATTGQLVDHSPHEFMRDQELIRELENMGFDQADIVKALRKEFPSAITAAYHLLVQKQQEISGKPSSDVEEGDLPEPAPMNPENDGGIKVDAEPAQTPAPMAVDDQVTNASSEPEDREPVRKVILKHEIAEEEEGEEEEGDNFSDLPTRMRGVEKHTTEGSSAAQSARAANPAGTSGKTVARRARRLSGVGGPSTYVRKLVTGQGRQARNTSIAKQGSVSIPLKPREVADVAEIEEASAPEDMEKDMSKSVSEDLMDATHTNNIIAAADVKEETPSNGNGRIATFQTNAPLSTVFDVFQNNFKTYSVRADFDDDRSWNCKWTDLPCQKRHKPLYQTSSEEEAMDLIIEDLLDAGKEIEFIVDVAESSVLNGEEGTRTITAVVFRETNPCPQNESLDFCDLVSRLMEEAPTVEDVAKMKGVESADYHVPDTLHHRQRMTFMRKKHVLFSTIIDWIMTLLVAVFVAIVVLFIHASFEFIAELRNELVEHYITEDWMSLFAAFGVDWGVMVAFVTVACLLTVWAPESAQSEGPIIHIGSAIASLVMRGFRRMRERLERHPTLHPFRGGTKSLDADERDAVAIGAGCGVSAAFNVPVGGALFVLEEASSFLELSTIRRSFFGAFVAYGIAAFFHSINNTFTVLSDHPSNPLCNNRQLFTRDIVCCFFIGTIGGMLGALFNTLVTRVMRQKWEWFDVIWRGLKRIFHLGKSVRKRSLNGSNYAGASSLQSDDNLAENGGTTPNLSTPSSATKPPPPDPSRLKWRKVLFTLGLTLIVSMVRVFLPAVFECKPSNSQLYFEHPSMCFGSASERQMFSGVAYVPGVGVEAVNGTPFYSSEESCLAFSRSMSVETLVQRSTRKGVNGDDNRANGEQLNARNVDEDWTDHDHEMEGTAKWGSVTPGLRSLGHIFPIPLPGLYKSASIKDDNVEEGEQQDQQQQNTTGIPISMSWAVRHICPPGHFNPFASLVLSTPHKAVRLMFTRGSATILPLGVLASFLATYGLIMALVVGGAFLPAGSFLPQMMIGAAFGRIVGAGGTWWAELFCKAWVHLPYLAISEQQRMSILTENGGECLKMCGTAPDPSLFAIVGAASFMVGVTRSPLFVAVVIAEMTDDLSSITPVGIGVLTAFWVGNLFNRGLYHMIIHHRGLSYLDFEPELPYERKSVSRVMSQPVVTLPRFVTLGELSLFLGLGPISALKRKSAFGSNTGETILKTAGTKDSGVAEGPMKTRVPAARKGLLAVPGAAATHNGFPVVRSDDDPILIGFVLRKRLEKIVKMYAKGEGLKPSLMPTKGKPKKGGRVANVGARLKAMLNRGGQRRGSELEMVDMADLMERPASTPIKSHQSSSSAPMRSSLFPKDKWKLDIKTNRGGAFNFGFGGKGKEIDTDLERSGGGPRSLWKRRESTESDSTPLTVSAREGGFSFGLKKLRLPKIMKKFGPYSAVTGADRDQTAGFGESSQNLDAEDAEDESIHQVSSNSKLPSGEREQGTTGNQNAGPGANTNGNLADTVIDLSEHMDRSPMRVPENFSLSRAYILFRKQGLRHLVVVNRRNLVAGIITRRDLLPWAQEDVDDGEADGDEEDQLSFDDGCDEDEDEIPLPFGDGDEDDPFDENVSDHDSVDGGGDGDDDAFAVGSVGSDLEVEHEMMDREAQIDDDAASPPGSTVPSGSAVPAAIPSLSLAVSMDFGVVTRPTVSTATTATPVSAVDITSAHPSAQPSTPNNDLFYNMMHHKRLMEEHEDGSSFDLSILNHRNKRSSLMQLNDVSKLSLEVSNNGDANETPAVASPPVSSPVVSKGKATTPTRTKSGTASPRRLQMSSYSLRKSSLGSPSVKASPTASKSPLNSTSTFSLSRQKAGGRSARSWAEAASIVNLLGGADSTLALAPIPTEEQGQEQDRQKSLSGLK
ncbi:hypothetical protein HK102_012030 [Quaeritorhiza haematococci]|nr:hypothetical protein HK102_012030 [Quaeritorhiza haematococci]